MALLSEKGFDFGDHSTSMKNRLAPVAFPIEGVETQNKKTGRQRKTGQLIERFSVTPHHNRPAVTGNPFTVTTPWVAGVVSAAESTVIMVESRRRSPERAYSSSATGMVAFVCWRIFDIHEELASGILRRRAAARIICCWGMILHIVDERPSVQQPGWYR